MTQPSFHRTAWTGYALAREARVHAPTFDALASILEGAKAASIVEKMFAA